MAVFSTVVTQRAQRCHPEQPFSRQPLAVRREGAGGTPEVLVTRPSDGRDDTSLNRATEMGERTAVALAKAELAARAECLVCRCEDIRYNECARRLQCLSASARPP